MVWNNGQTNFALNLAVVIGINNYKNGINQLKTPVNDASAIANLLENQYDYQVIRLFPTEAQPDQEATLEKLQELLEKTLPEKITSPTETRLLFYFAGHGKAINNESGPAGYLVPQNANLADLNTFLPMSVINEGLISLKCHHLLVILDCCFAGSFRWSNSRNVITPPEKIHKEHFDRFIRYNAAQAITSAAANQAALDYSSTQREVTPDCLHSPFAKALIEALQEGKADFTQDRVISTPELYLYLRDQLKAEDGSELQTPGSWPLADHDRGEFIFTLPDFSTEKLAESPPLEPDNNPYRGLKSFAEVHSKTFFGRDHLIENLSKQLYQLQQPLIIVLGSSGSGKSSLVKAGLIPALRERSDWYILNPMRPSEKPFKSLAKAILPLVNEPLLSELKLFTFFDDLANISTMLSSQIGDLKSLKMWQEYATLSPPGKLSLIIDYFEQLTSDNLSVLSGQKQNLSQFHQKLENTLKLAVNKLRERPKFLGELIKSWSASHPHQKILLVIDQFEELITTVSCHEEKNLKPGKKVPTIPPLSMRFLKTLQLALLEYPEVFRVVITLRSDYESRFLYSPLRSYWEKGRFPVGAMNSDELRLAIECPASQQAIYFDPPDLVGKLIDEVGQMPGALSLLSFTLSELYIKLYQDWVKEGTGDRALKEKYYQELGGISGSLSNRAAQEYESPELDELHRDTMRRVILRMVTLEGGQPGRRRVPLSELIYPDKNHPGQPDIEENQRVKSVLERLDQARLIVTGQDLGESYVELAHDFLVKGWDKLQQWLEEEQENIILQRRLTQIALDWKKETIKNKNKYLWPDNPYLNVLEELIRSPQHYLNQIETEFILQSIYQKQNRKNLIWGLGITTMTIFFALAIVGLTPQREAKISQVLALRESAEINANDRNLDQLISILKAVKLIQKDWLLQTFKPTKTVDLVLEKSLQKAVYNVQELRRFSLNNYNTENILGIFAINDGEILFVTFAENKIKLINQKMEKLAEITIPFQDLSAARIKFNQDGSTIAIKFLPTSPKTLKNSTQTSTIYLWNWQQNQLKIYNISGFIDIHFTTKNQPLLVTHTSNNAPVKLLTLEQKVEDNFNLPKELSNGHQIERLLFNAKANIAMVFYQKDGMKGIDFYERKLANFLLVKRDINKKHPQAGLSPDGKWIATSYDNGIINLRNSNGMNISEFNAQSPVIMLVFSADSNALVTVSLDKTLRVWDLREKQLSKLGPLIKDNIQDVVWSHQRLNRLAIAHSDGRISVINGKEKIIFASREAQNINSINFSYKGGKIAIVTNDNIIKIFKLNGDFLLSFPLCQEKSTNLRNRRYQVGKNMETSLVFTADNQKIGVTRIKDNIVTACVQYLMNGQLVGKLHRHTKATQDLVATTFNNDGRLIEVKVSYYGANNVDGLLEKRLDDELIAIAYNVGKLKSISLSHDADLLATLDEHNIVKLFEKNGRKSIEFQVDQPGLTHVTLSPNGRILGTIGKDGSLQLWRVGRLDYLVKRACDWVGNYLENNPLVAKEDRHLCDDIPPIVDHPFFGTTALTK